MVLTVAMDPEQYVKITTEELSPSFEENFTKFQLSYATGDIPPFQYVQKKQHADTSDEQSLRYARYLLLLPVYENGTALPTDHILKIESHVLFQKGALTGEKVMESFI
ncbi:MAG: hypothetical protein LBP53_08825 [Candidatus Peribacteria bacterium]|jgi:hypothetical protein|nr:hypothetical protein [Candidatus Peribacteria bacterium]